MIELPNLILLRTSATTTVYTYNYMDAAINNGTNTIAANAWSTTYFAAAGVANAAGGMWASSCNSAAMIVMPARFNTSSVGRVPILMFGITGSITGAWTSAIVYDGSVALTVGSCGCWLHSTMKVECSISTSTQRARSIRFSGTTQNVFCHPIHQLISRKQGRRLSAGE